jgi:hypothetical protein
MRVGGVYTVHPPPFTISTTTYNVEVYAPAERADTLLPFLLYPYMYSVDLHFKEGGMENIIYTKLESGGKLAARLNIVYKLD